MRWRRLQGALRLQARDAEAAAAAAGWGNGVGGGALLVDARVDGGEGGLAERVGVEGLGDGTGQAIQVPRQRPETAKAQRRLYS